MTALAQAADVVLPGAAWVEKDASYVNGQGACRERRASSLRRARRRRTGRSSSTSGSRWARPDLRQQRRGSRRPRRAALAAFERYAGLRKLAFARPVSAKHWLQASNPSERWKWDFMFQDLPPVKFAGKPTPTSLTSYPSSTERVKRTSEPARQHV